VNGEKRFTVIHCFNIYHLENTKVQLHVQITYKHVENTIENESRKHVKNNKNKRIFLCKHFKNKRKFFLNIEILFAYFLFERVYFYEIRA